MKTQELNRMKNEYRFYPSGYPKPPCGRLIREGDSIYSSIGMCPICGSSLKRKILGLIKTDKCVQPECPNCYGEKSGYLRPAKGRTKHNTLVKYI